MLVSNPRGNFSFLKGVSAFSAGAVAAQGFEIEHARLARPLALADGFAAIARRLDGLGRDRQALCGIELRSPRPFSFEGFAEFNAGYVRVLESWDILCDGLNPVARTNVAPEVEPPDEPALYGFSYTVPARDARPTFVVAGGAEITEGTRDVVRAGETSADAIEEKARFVLELMDARVRALGAGWELVTTVDVYTVHDIGPLVRDARLARGVTWHFARPPIAGLEFEMDARGCRREFTE